MAKLAYITRSGEYKSRRDLVDTSDGNLPNWAGDSVSFWKAVDDHSRSNARLFTEVEFALPIELTPEQQRGLVIAYVAEICKCLGCSIPYTWAIHTGAGRNPHVHLILAAKVDDGLVRANGKTWLSRATCADKPSELCGARSWSGATNASWIKHVRSRWAAHANAALESAGLDERIDHRSYRAQGIELLPTWHVGWGGKEHVARIEEKNKEICKLNLEIVVTKRARLEAQAIEEARRQAEAEALRRPIWTEGLEIEYEAQCGELNFLAARVFDVAALGDRLRLRISELNRQLGEPLPQAEHLHRVDVRKQLEQAKRELTDAQRENDLLQGRWLAGAAKQQAKEKLANAERAVARTNARAAAGLDSETPAAVEWYRQMASRQLKKEIGPALLQVEREAKEAADEREAAELAYDRLANIFGHLRDVRSNAHAMDRHAGRPVLDHDAQRAAVGLALEAERRDSQLQRATAEFEAEAARRIADLPLVTTRAGTDKLFAEEGLEAIKTAGNAERVLWKAVEIAVARQSIAVNGQEPSDVLRALLQHSPARADPTTHAQLRALIVAEAPRLKAIYANRHTRDDDHSGPDF